MNGMNQNDNGCDDDHDAGNFLCPKSEKVETGLEEIEPKNQGLCSVAQFNTQGLSIV